MLHEIHPGVQSKRLLWTRAWDKSWSQDGTKYLERDFGSIQAQSCRNTRDGLNNPRLKCQFPFLSLFPCHFFHLHPLSEYIIFTYCLCHLCFRPNSTIKYIKCFPSFPLLAFPVISFVWWSSPCILRKDSVYIISWILAHSKLFFIAWYMEEILAGYKSLGLSVAPLDCLVLPDANVIFLSLSVIWYFSLKLCTFFVFKV